MANRDTKCPRALRLFAKDLRRYFYSRRTLRLQPERFVGMWGLGGCWIVAEALHAWIGPGSSLLAIYGSTPLHPYGVHHVVVKVGGCYLDDQRAMSEDQLLRYWEEDQEVEEINLDILDPADAKAMGIKCPVRIVRALVKGLDETFGDGEQVLEWAGII